MVCIQNKKHQMKTQIFGFTRQESMEKERVPEKRSYGGTRTI